MCIARTSRRGATYTRTVDNRCLDLPTEGKNVLSINAIGPSTRKADYSNYGLEQIDGRGARGVLPRRSALEGLGPAEVRALRRDPEPDPRRVPRVGRAGVRRDRGADGTPNTPFVLRDCRGTTCAYYQYLQGTSMASPHAAGVVALIVGKHGDGPAGNPPNLTERILEKSATDHACPEPRLHSYADKLRAPSFDAFCDGTPKFNGFYGHGIVDALRAVEQGISESGDE